MTLLLRSRTIGLCAFLAVSAVFTVSAVMAQAPEHPRLS
jgi:hypothetical protein